MRIQVNFKPLSKMRYTTLGDYYSRAGLSVFDVADTGNRVYNMLILIHEMGEEMLTRAKGIPEQVISAFDNANINADEPGLLPDAPYRNEHLLMEGIERLLLAHLGMDWSEYERVCKQTWDVEDKPDASEL